MQEEADNLEGGSKEEHEADAASDVRSEKDGHYQVSEEEEEEDEDEGGGEAEEEDEDEDEDKDDSDSKNTRKRRHVADYGT